MKEKKTRIKQKTSNFVNNENLINLNNDINNELTTTSKSNNDQSLSKDDKKLIESLISLKFDKPEDCEEMQDFRKRADLICAKAKDNKDIDKELLQLKKDIEYFKIKSHLELAKSAPLMQEFEAMCQLDKLNELADCKNIALHAKNELKPNDFLERILIDQSVITHTFGIKFLSNVHERWKDEDISIDVMTKMTNLSARMLDISQKAALTLNKLRTGGTQTVLVKHQQVQVNGGQTVIANDIVSSKRGSNNEK